MSDDEREPHVYSLGELHQEEQKVLLRERFLGYAMFGERPNLKTDWSKPAAYKGAAITFIAALLFAGLYKMFAE